MLSSKDAALRCSTYWVCLLLWAWTSGAIAQPPSGEISAQRKRLWEESQKFAAENNWPEAIDRAKSVVSLERSRLPALAPGLVEPLTYLATLYEKSKAHESALPLRRELTSIQNAHLGMKHPDAKAAVVELGKQLYEVGLLNQKAGKHGEAKKLFDERLALFSNRFGPESKGVAWCHNACAWADFGLKDYATARSNWDNALKIFRKEMGDDSPEAATAIENLIVATSMQGDLDAERKYREVQIHLLTAQAAKRPNVAIDALHSTAYRLLGTGEFLGAWAILEKAADLCEKHLRNDDPLAAKVYADFSIQLNRQGDAATAIRYTSKAVAIQSKAAGENDASTARIMMIHAATLVKSGRKLEALPVCKKAHEILVRAKGSEDVMALQALANYAFVLADEKPREALPLMEQCLLSLSKAKGEGGRDSSMVLANMASAQWRLGDKAASLRSMEHANRIRRSRPLPVDDELIRSLEREASLLILNEESEKARPLLEEAATLASSMTDRAARYQTERQQLALAGATAQVLQTYLDLPCSDSAATNRAHSMVLRWKGSVFARQHLARIEERNPDAEKVRKQIRELGLQISTLARIAPPTEAKEAWNLRLQELATRKEALERKLAADAKSQPAAESYEQVAQRILQTLPKNGALLDFVTYRRKTDALNAAGEWSYQPRLSAFVMKPGQPVQRVDLGALEPIEQSIDAWRAKIQVRSSKDLSGQELRRLLWKPLERHLEGVSLVLLAPDGPLGRLPFAALPGNSPDRYLIEEIAIAVLPIPRLLRNVADGETATAKRSLLLVGDVDFDAEPGALEKKPPAIASARNGSDRRWSPLPGTRGEMDSIGKLFSQRFGSDRTKAMRRDQATESAFREESAKHSIIHVATHGFFAPIEAESADSKAGGEASSAPPTIWTLYPGLSCGLVFAGANRPLDPNRDDGILSAMEVADLDLSHVDLAVLSACETGLGKDAAGEGVLGLQRAFQLAGAKTTVTSLWSIPDEPTRILMEQFYAKLLDPKVPRSKLEALREAQLWMLREGRRDPSIQRGIVRLQPQQIESSELLPPYYWAAFVLSGDWR
jgi:CHAT domain-containing protein